jgi:hypothetical protein
LNGGAGNDLLLYRLDGKESLADLGGDAIIGFEVGKDKIDLRDLFEDTGVTQDPFADGFLKFEVVGGDTRLLVDSDGDGDGFVTIATLQGVTNLTLSDLFIPLAVET